MKGLNKSPIQYPESPQLDQFYFERLQSLYTSSSSSFFLAGTDEVGRGPLAGPVVAATAALCGFTRELDLLPFWKALAALGVTDSKKLKSAKRQLILSSYQEIADAKLPQGLKLKLALAEVSEQEIDRINILQASLLAMRKSCEELRLIDDFQQRGIVLIDGNKKINGGLGEEIPVIKGDAKSLLIGLASIAAKEYRDQLMTRLGEKYPGYGLEKHAGYPTPLHLEAIKVKGPSPIHRLSFKGVKEYVSRNS